jgi:mannose-1-phosphate guanylyltransferase
VRALLLAAGFGTRLRPMTNHIPKCLVRIHDRPLLDYWLEQLLSDSVDRILINTHYLPDAVRDFVKTNTCREKIELVHEDILLGTGGTILFNREFFSDGPFMVAHADNLTRFDVPAFIDAHRVRPSGVDITMMTFDTDAPETCGIVEQDGRGIIVGFHEKSSTPPGCRANAAVYIFEPTIFDYLISLNKDVIDLSLEVIPRYIGRMHGFHNSVYHRDIGTPESLRKAEDEFQLI